MDNLYKVWESNNRYGKEHYVFAKSFNEAANKLKAHLTKKIVEAPILNKDGDLNLSFSQPENTKEIIIGAIELIDDAIIIK